MPLGRSNATTSALTTSSEGPVWIVSGRALIRPLVSTVTSTANPFRWPTIATNNRRDVFFKSMCYDVFVDKSR